MAGIGGGHLPPETDWAVTGSVVEPRPETREVYDALYAAYTQLYPLTKDIMHELARLQEKDFADADQASDQVAR